LGFGLRSLSEREGREGGKRGRKERGREWQWNGLASTASVWERKGVFVHRKKSELPRLALLRVVNESV